MDEIPQVDTTPTTNIGSFSAIEIPDVDFTGVSTDPRVTIPFRAPAGFPNISIPDTAFDFSTPATDPGITIPFRAPGDVGGEMPGYQQFLNTQMPNVINGLRYTNEDFITLNPLMSKVIRGMDSGTGKFLWDEGSFRELELTDQMALSSVRQQNKSRFETLDQTNDSHKQGLLDRLFEDKAVGLQAVTALVGTLGTLYFMWEQNEREWKIYEETREEDKRQFDLMYEAKYGRSGSTGSTGSTGVVRSAGEAYV